MTVILPAPAMSAAAARKVLPAWPRSLCAPVDRAVAYEFGTAPRRRADLGAAPRRARLEGSSV